MGRLECASRASYQPVCSLTNQYGSSTNLTDHSGKLMVEPLNPSKNPDRFALRPLPDQMIIANIDLMLH
jgi:hypothetical protein